MKRPVPTRYEGLITWRLRHEKWSTARIECRSERNLLITAFYRDLESLIVQMLTVEGIAYKKIPKEYRETMTTWRHLNFKTRLNHVHRFRMNFSIRDIGNCRPGFTAGHWYGHEPMRDEDGTVYIVTLVVRPTKPTEKGEDGIFRLCRECNLVYFETERSF